jgi:tetratricopeptide (TPR) repeat protein
LARRALGEHQGAIDDFTKVLSLDEHNFYAYNNRCGEKRLLEQKKNRVYKNNPNLEDAMKDCDRAIVESSQKYASPFFNRAVINAIQGKLKAAIEDFETSAQTALREENDTALYNSSLIEAKRLMDINELSRSYSDTIAESDGKIKYYPPEPRPYYHGFDVDTDKVRNRGVFLEFVDFYSNYRSNEPQEKW